MNTAMMNTNKTTLLLLFLIVGCFCIITLSSAGEIRLEKVDLPPPESEKIVLTVNTPGDPQKYSLADIEKLGLHRLKTTTYWQEDDGVYEGVLLKTLLEDAGIADSNKIRITALDNYTAEIPREDWEKWPILLATRRDGKAMSVRKRGPLRIIYPKDLGGEVADTVMRVRWVWAIKQISPK